MIEVERKFVINKTQPTFLEKSKARFLGKQNLNDTYYDTEDYSLTTQNIWVRKRNGSFEVKKPLAQNKIDRYEELTKSPEIKNFLDLDPQLSIAEGLTAKKYMPFATYHTERKSYQIDEFEIDLDYVDFGKWSSLVGEIELQVKNKTEVKTAIKKIKDFAQRHNLILKKKPGKLALFLEKESPEHYKALIDAGVIKSSYVKSKN